MSPNLRPEPALEVEPTAEDWALSKQAAEEVPTTRRQEDMKLFAAYKKDPSPDTFQPLYRAFKPFLMKATYPNMNRSPIPQSVHVGFAAQNFHDALQKFNPAKGASLHTHVHGWVREKGKRLNYKYQNIGYIPEARATKYQLFQNTVQMLKDLHGREPSTLELADEIKWSPKMVETMREEIRRPLLLDETMAEAYKMKEHDSSKQLLYDVHYGLTPPHQLVLEHVAELYGRKAPVKPGGGTDLNALSKVTGLKVPQIRSAFKTITRRVNEYRGIQNAQEAEEVE